MFFIISKILGFLVSPFTWVAAGIIYSLFSRVPERKRKSLIASCIIFLIFSNEFLAEEALRSMEVENVQLKENEKFDVGIVLGGMIRYDAQNDHLIFNQNIDRLLQPVLLLKKKQLNKILISGGSGDINHPEIIESKLLKRFLIELGVDSNDIWVETQSKNTRQNAEYSAALLKTKFKNLNDKKILLITSSTHMERSVGCFKKVGLNVIPYGTGKLSGPRDITFQRLLVPNIWAVHMWEIYFHETIGYWTYRIAGYID